MKRNEVYSDETVDWILTLTNFPRPSVIEALIKCDNDVDKAIIYLKKLKKIEVK